MISGEVPDLRLKKRVWILSNLEAIIKESVYYRNNSSNMDYSERIELINIDEDSGELNLNENI
jgi:hypothetical protein